jgi:hypothetical protein
MLLRLLGSLLIIPGTFILWRTIGVRAIGMVRQRGLEDLRDYSLSPSCYLISKCGGNSWVLSHFVIKCVATGIATVMIIVALCCMVSVRRAMGGRKYSNKGAASVQPLVLPTSNDPTR